MKLSRTQIAIAAVSLIAIWVLYAFVQRVQTNRMAPSALAAHVGAEFISGNTNLAWKHLNDCEKSELPTSKAALRNLRDWATEMGVDWDSFDLTPADLQDGPFRGYVSYVGRTYSGEPLTLIVSARKQGSQNSVSIVYSIVALGTRAKLYRDSPENADNPVYWGHQITSESGRLSGFGFPGLPEGDPFDNCEVRSWEDIQSRSMERMYPDSFGR